MIPDHQLGQKSLFSEGFSVVSGRRGTGFIESAGEPLLGDQYHHEAGKSQQLAAQ